MRYFTKSSLIMLCIVLVILHPAYRSEVRAETGVASHSNAQDVELIDISMDTASGSNSFSGSGSDTEVSIMNLLIVSNLLAALNLGCSCAAIFSRYVRG